MIHKLSAQVGILFFLNMGLVLGLFSWFEYHKEAEQLRLHAETKAIDTAELIAASINSQVLYQKSFSLWKQMNRIQQRFSHDTEVMLHEFAILDRKNNVLTHSNPKTQPIMQHMSIPAQGMFWKKDQLTIVSPVLHPSRDEVIGNLLLVFHAHAIQRELTTLKQNITIALCLALVLSIILAIGMAHRVSSPLKKLTKLSKHLGKGHMDISSFLSTPKEIKQLAKAMQRADHSIHQSAQALIQSESLLNDVLDHSPAVIFIKDIHGKYILINKRFSDLFHISTQQVVGKSDTDLFDDALVKQLHQHDVQVIEQNKALMLEECIPDDRGERFYYSLKFPLRDEKGQIYAVCGIATDITEQKEITAQLRKLATIITQTDEMVIVTDKQGIIEYVNPAFERISGYTAHEALGNTPSMLKSDHQPSSYYQAMWRTLNRAQVWRGDLTNLNKDGQEYEVSLSIIPILNEKGDTVGFSSTQRDVTQQRKVQQKLQHTDRVESLGVLAGGIAHDFNNLLTAILGNASLAYYKLEENSPIRSHLDAIERASQSAADLCKQMLAYSGKGKFVVKAINLSELVENMGKLIDVSIAKNISLQYHLSKKLPLIDADIAQMQQVILNLMTNASEAIHQTSGVISMSTGEMHADASYLNGCIGDEHLKSGDYVYLEVSDTGCGMDAATQKKMFDPFFTTKFTGRGLGMSAMLGIIKGHQGGLRIYSEVGQGTSIKIVFPLSHQHTQTPTAHINHRDPQPTFSGTALIIDDEKHVRDIACVMLQELGFITRTAPDGIEGLELFRTYQQDISLVVLDMTMPRMDGSACFSALRQIQPDISVILSSGYNEQDATNRFAGKGLAGFLQKPYSLKQLTEKVKSVFPT